MGEVMSIISLPLQDVQRKSGNWPALLADRAATLVGHQQAKMGVDWFRSIPPFDDQQYTLDFQAAHRQGTCPPSIEGLAAAHRRRCMQQGQPLHRPPASTILANRCGPSAI